MPQPLIINADDFGLTDVVCQAIVELGQGGGISSTTAMLGVPEALPRIHRYWDKLTIPCGVHLHLTYGAPISKGMQQYCASRWDGQFPRLRTEIAYPADLAMEECRAQVELFRQEFGQPSHLDTHHGFHRDSRYRAGLLQLAREYGLPMRGGDGGEEVAARDYGVAESSVLEAWSNTGWDTPEAGLVKLREVLGQARTAKLSGVWELVCHPGYTDGHLRAITTLNDRRELERQVLGGVEARALWQEFGVELVNFKALGARDKTSVVEV
jgi:predicted glycoside hydrolase/deacetylase ChbG (UPF0249 family)